MSWHPNVLYFYMYVLMHKESFILIKNCLMENSTISAPQFQKFEFKVQIHLNCSMLAWQDLCTENLFLCTYIYSDPLFIGFTNANYREGLPEKSSILITTTWYRNGSEWGWLGNWKSRMGDGLRRRLARLLLGYTILFRIEVGISSVLYSL